MQTAAPYPIDTQRYARCIAASRRIRWDIDRDVIRGRSFDLSHKFLPDGLSLVDELTFLTPAEQRFLSQVQGRTYANMFGLVERFVSAKVTDLSRDHCLGDQTALEALVRFTDEELKHQELFRRIEKLVAVQMPAGYHFDAMPNDVAAFVLSKRNWAVLAMICQLELFSQAHYRASISTATGLSDLYKDVFLYHWREESQHAIMDELEWLREDARIENSERDAAIDDLVALVAGMDEILQAQAKADAGYFLKVTGKQENSVQAMEIEATVLKAYRWTYIVTGVLEPRFCKLLGDMVSEAQMARIQSAMAPLMYAMPASGQPLRAMAA
ncbi:hypothetical protein [Cupriavidus sp. IDO]|uniref:hypothetical protein n=1 Tax=Cupriavidus sp. IDO TaxID=1539142 RepID=UPI00057918F7|nr:hypothetical protein [Cupriavidus sp. IDO]KWR92141.1 hypothetical protein RM96_00025 [Cupriavidus sp. IDO]